MINFKQEELIAEIVDKIKGQFPEVELINIVESPEDPETRWINVTTPEDEDRELDLLEFTGDITTEILMDYGYYLLVIPTHRVKEAV